MIEFIFNGVKEFIYPAAMIMSVAINLILISSKWYKFKFNFHKLEHLKLQLEIRKLRRDLDGGSNNLTETLEIKEEKAVEVEDVDKAEKNIPLINTWFRVKYSIMWLVRGLFFVLSVTVFALAVMSGSGDGPKTITVTGFLSLVSINLTFVIVSVYLNEWVKFNRERLK